MLPHLVYGLKKNVFKIDSICWFYIIIVLIGGISYFYAIIMNGFSYRGCFLFLLSNFFWIFYLIFYMVIKRWIENSLKENIERVLMLLFWTNVLVCGIQYLLMVIEFKALNPFLTEMGTSAGDNIKGIFANSSVNMIVNSFFLIYFLVERKKMILIFSTIIIILFTSYMSGILCFMIAFAVFYLFNKNISVKLRIISLLSFILFLFMFYILSVDNIIYSYSILESIFTISPPRKVVSFLQTFEFLTSSAMHFFLGAAPGHFSSRVAFMAGGEFVDWFPSALSYKSIFFNKYHFQLWNYDVLSIPFNDGTANQPFSVYNQILGEYGILGLISFFILYLKGLYKKIAQLPYSSLLMTSTLLYLFLDYWFEYFSCMIILEILILTLHKQLLKNG